MSLLLIITKCYFILCSSSSIIAASGGLIVLRPTRSPEATAETTHTLRKWTIEDNLKLNTQGLMECKICMSKVWNRTWDLFISLSGTDPNTLKITRPPLWARRQRAHLSRSGTGFDTRSGQVSWVRFFGGFAHL